MCLHPAPAGAGCKTRLESRIKRFLFDWGFAASPLPTSTSKLYSDLENELYQAQDVLQQIWQVYTSSANIPQGTQESGKQGPLCIACLQGAACPKPRTAHVVSTAPVAAPVPLPSFSCHATRGLMPFCAVLCPNRKHARAVAGGVDPVHNDASGVCVVCIKRERERERERETRCVCVCGGGMHTYTVPSFWPALSTYILDCTA